MNPIPSWLKFRRKPSTKSELPLGLEPQQLEALKQLTSSPQWKHYITVLERLGEQQAAEVASGLPHDRYLFASGALTALRRVFTLTDDLFAAAQHLKEHTNAREHRRAVQSARNAAAFVNTPWYDGWRRTDAASGG